MPKAEIISITTRRRMLTLAPAALIIPTFATAADGPDAALIAACAEFLHLERMRYEFADQDPDDEEIQNALLHRQEAPMNRLFELRAATLAGHRARAECLASWCEGAVFDEENDTWECLMTRAIVRDLIA